MSRRDVNSPLAYGTPIALAALLLPALLFLWRPGAAASPSPE